MSAKELTHFIFEEEPTAGCEMCGCKECISDCLFGFEKWLDMEHKKVDADDSQRVDK
jgi:hypothetical protein